jgi:uncharacterized cupin superfamily protein
MSDYAIKSIDELAVHQGIVRLAGAELGVGAFGLQVLDLPPGFEHYPEHDHAEDGQEEVYVVLDGAGEVRIDGDAVPVAPGALVRVGAGTRRKLEPGRDGLKVLAIGRTRDGAYERPEDFRL